MPCALKHQCGCVQPVQNTTSCESIAVEASLLLASSRASSSGKPPLQGLELKPLLKQTRANRTLSRQRQYIAGSMGLAGLVRLPFARLAAAACTWPTPRGWCCVAGACAAQALVALPLGCGTGAVPALILQTGCDSKLPGALDRFRRMQAS